MRIVFRIFRRATARTGMAIFRRRWTLLAGALAIVALIVASVLNWISLPASQVSTGTVSAHSRVGNEPEATAMYFHGQKTFDARLVWYAYSDSVNRARLRQGISQEQMQNQLEELRRRGDRIESAEFVSSYPVSNGKIAFYAVTKVASNAGSRRGDVETIPYAFMLDASDKIVAVY